MKDGLNFEDGLFLERIQTHLLITYIVITAIEIIYVGFKLLNICGDQCKFFLFTCSLEAYFTFFIDIFILITASIAYAVEI